MERMEQHKRSIYYLGSDTLEIALFAYVEKVMK